ncbi:RNA-binding protein [Candidatus Woesearchaeota archaeon]|nr:RNA-binding protein [Candidatus Woesearchaeota archaeon]
MSLLIKEKQLVIPGETLAKGMDFVPSDGTYRDGDEIVCGQLGLISVHGRVLRIIPLAGRYIPREEDVVIGRVVNMSLSSWQIDIGYAYEANLSLRDASSDFIERGSDLAKYYDFGDIVTCKVIQVNRAKFVDLTVKGPGLKKLKGGRIINISIAKIPRVIGKQGSMVSLIKQVTGCEITIGQNGRVWISGEPEKEYLAERSIYLVEREPQHVGLTDKVKAFLERGGVDGK